MTRWRPHLRTLLVVSSLAAALATPVFSAKLPDWAKSLAETAPPLPPGVPDSSFRILLSETQYSVQPDGTFRIRRRLATQALSVNTEEVDSGWYGFDETARVTGTRAWHLPPEDTAKKSHSLPVDITVGENFLTETKARVLYVEGVKKGSIVFFEFEATEKPYFLSLAHLFHERAPVTMMRFRLETPSGWTVRSAWLRQKGPEAAASGDARTWELRDLPAPVDEPLGVPAPQRAPLLIIDLLPPSGNITGPAVFPDWPSLSQWYENLAKGKDAVTPAIEAAAKQALANAGTGFLDRIRAEGIMVRDKVRYVDVELGVGGFQPRPAQDTLANLYGDCKDKGTLYQAVLAAGGTSSYPILVNVTNGEMVSEEVPAWEFNHLVVGVPLPADLAVPPEYAAAVADAGDLGRVLIVDTTDEHTSIGSLSTALAGQRALIAAGHRGRLITLPAAKPESQRMDRRILAEVHPDGSLVVEQDSRLTGEMASLARLETRRSSQNHRKKVEGGVMKRWPDAAILDYSAVLESPDGAYEGTLKYRRPAVTRQGSFPEIELFPGASDDLERVPLARRKTAVEYGFPRTVRYETTLKGIPENVSLPEPQNLQGEGWSVTTTYGREGSDVKATWELRLSRTRFEPWAFPNLRKLWSAVSSTAGWVLELPG